jgi:uncharacterized protein (TIGR02145 family)
VYVTIDSSSSAQVWMAENLNYNTNTDGSKCYAEGVAGVLQHSIIKNCAKCGRLYNWTTAMENSVSSNLNPSGVKGVCPSGWHLPSGAEWNVLMKVANPNCSDNATCSGAGTKLKATSDWNTSSGYIVGTDDYGFSALPGGIHRQNGSFGNADNYGNWWSTSDNGDRAYRWLIRYDYDDVHYSSEVKSSFYSIRCVKDNN